MRNLAAVVLLVLILATNSFAAPNLLRASTIPEHGILAALGGGLVTLATFVRHYHSK